MPDCEHNIDGFCRIATRLAHGKPARIKDPRACEVCQEDSYPKQPNGVTVSLALATTETSAEMRALHKELKRHIPVFKLHGPGHELTSILHGIGFKPTKGCKCFERAREMNEKGLAWCQKNKPTIVKWLVEEAEERGYSELFAKMTAPQAVTLALYNAGVAERRERKAKKNAAAQ
jgi:hypothetical protein